MKYFFLSDGWNVSRVWEFGGLWNENAWRRKPHIQQLSIGIVEQGETLWLYQVEEAVLMIEVKPPQSTSAASSIGQVVLKRLIASDEAIALLAEAEAIIKPSGV
ncbi:hypothetical protein IQ249_20950 [Lusitaniella coriacea LEGE 07157]|uniref:Uncharacterized protein n=1 Tax=Lusitaniella coriacea LEGE 07157 TaxID=945747 RepID=A0A8J7E4A9_9CYAN|nr:hypothetical protein [Lusitaniella coriacea]MBE9118364.1 hypothetical protein [Lusitaniella coriacea LEGE 07157]